MGRHSTKLALGLVLGALAACARTAADERVVLERDDSGAVRAERTERLVAGAWLAEGPFEARHADGTPATVGQYHAGLRTGAWRTWHPSHAADAGNAGDAGRSFASEGSYLLGRREGVWIFRAPDGTLDEDATGVYEDDERIASWHAEGIRRGMLKSGVLQEATYAGGLRNGPARGFHPDGSRESEGAYADGLRTGPWTYWTPRGDVDRARSGTYELDVKVAELGEGTAE